MTTFQTPIVAGVFQDEAPARNAVNALRNAGFGYDQVGVAMQGGAATPDLKHDLMNLGVPEERASYYEHEFESGHIVVSVRPDGRDDEAKNILHGNGATDFNAPKSESGRPAPSDEPPVNMPPSGHPEGPDTYNLTD